MPITKRDLRYLLQLAKALHYIGEALPDNDKRAAVLYHLIVAGEIVSKHTPKLSDEGRKLLPIQVCDILQNIRDNYTTHGGTIAAISEKDIIHALKIDVHSLEILKQIAYFWIAKESLTLFITKLDELVKLDKDRLAKAKSLIEELIHIRPYVEVDIAHLSPECREGWAPLGENAKSLCCTLLTEINSAFSDSKEKEARLTDLYATKTSETFSKRVAELIVLQGKIHALSPPKFAKSIPDFCRATQSTYIAIKKEITPLYISNTITKRDKEKTELLMKALSNELKLQTEALNRCEERDLAAYKFGLDTPTGRHICTIRWYLIVIAALFDALELKPSSDFANLRNQAIHRFDEIDCLREREVLKLIIEERCVPYDRIPEKEILAPEPAKRKPETLKEKEGPIREIEKKQRQEERPPPSASHFKPS